MAGKIWEKEFSYYSEFDYKLYVPVNFEKVLGWEDHLCQVLLTKPAEVVQEAIQVLEDHGRRVKEELKSELYYSSTHCQIVFQGLHYDNLIVTHAPIA